MDENEFEFEGSTYISVKSDGCDGCSFHKGQESCYALCKEVPFCAPSKRSDGIGVIFVEKQR